MFLSRQLAEAGWARRRAVDPTERNGGVPGAAENRSGVLSASFGRGSEAGGVAALKQPESGSRGSGTANSTRERRRNGPLIPRRAVGRAPPAQIARRARSEADAHGAADRFPSATPPASPPEGHAAPARKLALLTPDVRREQRANRSSSPAEGAFRSSATRASIARCSPINSAISSDGSHAGNSVCSSISKWFTNSSSYRSITRRASLAMVSGEASAASDRRVRTHSASPLWCCCESGIKLEWRSTRTYSLAPLIQARMVAYSGESW